MTNQTSNIITKQIVTGIVDTTDKQCPFGVTNKSFLDKHICAKNQCGAYIETENMRGCIRLIIEKTECTFVTQLSKNAKAE